MNQSMFSKRGNQGKLLELSIKRIIHFSKKFMMSLTEREGFDVKT